MIKNKKNVILIIALIILTSCNNIDNSKMTDGYSLNGDHSKVMEILKKAAVRTDEVYSYKSVITINENYKSKQNKTTINLKSIQEYNKNVGLHQVIDFTKGEITEKYVLKDRTYWGGLNNKTNKIEWEPINISYDESLEQSLIDWDVKDLLKIHDLKFKYLDIDNHKHKIGYIGHIKKSNESAIADALWNNLGIYITPFIGLGEIKMNGIIELDEKTFDVSQGTLTIIFNRKDKSDIEYNNAKIEVKLINELINQINDISLPEDIK